VRQLAAHGTSCPRPVADAEGIVRDHHFGEGRYEESERVIQRLLGGPGAEAYVFTFG
jgi:hypothetical protein